jgi:hypothetical protein
MTWRTPAELIAVGFDRARVVMMNEGHNGMLRCARTRRTGTAILATAHAKGCRALAMEALGDMNGPAILTTLDQRFGYLEQPEMSELVDAALALGWQLVAYECSFSQAPAHFAGVTHGLPFTNWREQQQAANLLTALGELPVDTRMLVWCGNSHHRKRAGAEWVPMGVRFAELGAEAFAIDQLATVSLAPDDTPIYPVTSELRAILDERGGTVGFLCDDPPAGFVVPAGWDALILSTDNAVS